MKIGSFEPKAAPAPVAGERKPANAASAAPAAPPSAAGASVALSASASMRVDAQGEGAFDGAKVDRIAQAIREGRFTINAGAIADKLIANAQELIGSASR